MNIKHGLVWTWNGTLHKARFHSFILDLWQAEKTYSYFEDARRLNFLVVMTEYLYIFSAQIWKPQKFKLFWSQNLISKDEKRSHTLWCSQKWHPKLTNISNILISIFTYCIAFVGRDLKEFLEKEKLYSLRSVESILITLICMLFSRFFGWITLNITFSEALNSWKLIISKCWRWFVNVLFVYIEMELKKKTLLK